MDAEGFEPAGTWDAFDGWCAPHPRPDQGPTWRTIPDLSCPHAQDGLHAGLHEQGGMGV
jgi:hypothetical protein